MELANQTQKTIANHSHLLTVEQAILERAQAIARSLKERVEEITADETLPDIDLPGTGESLS